MNHVSRLATLLLVAAHVGCAPAAVSLQSVDPVALAASHGAPAAPVASRDLRADAERLVQPSNARRQEAVRSLLAERGIAYEVQTVTNPGRTNDPRAEGQNLIVTLGAGDRDIVVGAHLDAVPLAEGRMSAGMVDNGAAVVILARLVETLRGAPLRHRLRVVFFDMEEIGLVGSRRYVEELAGERTAAMVNLDIAGYGDTVIFGPTESPGNETMYAALRLVCAPLALACLDFPRFPQSDDRSFQAAGIPNVSIATVPRADAHQLWLLLNGSDGGGLADGFVPAVARVIHTGRDQPDLLDATAMARTHDLLVALVRRLDATLP